MGKSIRVWFLVIAGLVVFVLPAFAGNNSGQAFSTWPDTGQTKCYDNSVEIPCPAVGAAFHGQDAQYNGSGRSYTDLGSGMIQDNVTGLIWEQKTNKDGAANYADPHDADNIYSWCDTNSATNGGYQGNCGTTDTIHFLAALNGANFGGHDDWRLPTINELSTLVDRGRNSPTIDPVFAATQSQGGTYWSSTPYAGSSGDAWTSDFHYGYHAMFYKVRSYYVRAVRGGQ